MLHRRLAFTCSLILGISRFTVAAPEDFYRAHLPEGVKVGMSLEELKKARPRVFDMDMSGFDRPAPPKPPDAPVTMGEVTRTPHGASASGYHFKGGKLGAVMGATKLGNKFAAPPVEETQPTVNKLLEELKANFVFKGQEQIVRSGGLDGAALLTAQLWEDKAAGLQLYFVATNQGIEIVIFEPKAFAKVDFFPGPETLEKSKASTESIRRELGDRADPPLPLIDLLAKPPTEKK